MTPSNFIMEKVAPMQQQAQQNVEVVIPICSTYLKKHNDMSLSPNRTAAKIRVDFQAIEELKTFVIGARSIDDIAQRIEKWEERY